MEKVKILIAEDEITTQKIYEKGLPQTVFDLRIVSNGKDALKTWLEWQPEIMVLDMRMPGMTGYNVLKEVRKTHHDTDTIVVMATMVSAKDDVLACIEMGIQGYIVKPVAVNDIGKKVLAYYVKKAPAKGKAALAALTSHLKKAMF